MWSLLAASMLEWIVRTCTMCVGLQTTKILEI